MSAVKRDRWINQTIYASFTLAAVLAIVVYVNSLGHKVTDLQDGYAAVKTSAVANHDAAIANQDAASRLQKQVIRLGHKPVAGPQSIPVAPSRTGPAGPAGPAPSAQQVLGAVSAYCSLGSCVHGPSQAQVAAAVASYCSQGTCSGTAGTQGPAGPSGQSATPGQVADAVSAYCSTRSNCAGPAGPAGADGATGPAGGDGKDGKDGADAFPFSFTFTVPSTLTDPAHTYDCTVTDPDAAASCHEETSG